MPQLARTGFMFARSIKKRQLVVLDVTTVAGIRDAIAKGQLFIMPKRDILPSVALSVSVPGLVKFFQYVVASLFEISVKDACWLNYNGLYSLTKV